jgi:uncharacterized membrane protein
MKTDGKFDGYLLAMVAASLLFVIYWVTYAFYRYQSFGSYFWDLGQETYSMYVHLHSPGLVYGLQFLAFSNHLSVFKVLLLPIFALYQNPMTLILLQDVAVALCAVVAYLIGRDLVKSKPVGLALGLAFLLSPGVRGIVFFDVHAEAFIPLFFLLSFYFYMRNRKGPFFASYILMLSVIETAPFVGISLLAALLLYEFVYVPAKTPAEIVARKGRLKVIAAAFLVSLLFILFYYYVANSLVSMYRLGDYNAMPPFLRIVNFLSIQVKTLGNTGGVQYNQGAIAYLMLWGLLILFLGFGLTGFRNIILTLILVSPWILEVLILHNTVFSVLYYHYYAYVVGGAVVAAALGFMIIVKKKKRAFHIRTERFVRILASLTVVMAVIVSAILLPALPNLPGFLPTNWKTLQNYSTVESALDTIPSNASVLTQPSIASHLYRVVYLELPPDDTVGGFSPVGFVNNFDIVTYYNSTPEYIILDKQLPDYALFNSSNVLFNGRSGSYANPVNVSQFDVNAYMGGNYSLHSSSGGLEIYKRNGPGTT